MSQNVLAKMDDLLEEPARELVRVFYEREAAHSYTNKADFIGELFTELGSDTNTNSFEAEDLLAVHMMGMTFKPTATDALLSEGPERSEVSGLLAKIPSNVDIWDASDFGAANDLWYRLAREKREKKKLYPGINWVTAGKLLARKRPRLVPVIDSVVTALLPRAETGYWDLFREYLRLPDRIEKVESLRPIGVLPSSTPTLRLLDTAIWMRGSRGPASAVRRKLRLPD